MYILFIICAVSFVSLSLSFTILFFFLKFCSIFNSINVRYIIVINLYKMYIILD